VLQGEGQIKKSIVCPYHRWAYDVDGCLLHIPQRREFEEPIDESSLGLRPARLAEHKGMVFVHPDPDGESLVEWLGDFPEYHGPYEPEHLVEVSTESYVINCNWKTYIENHEDGYHLEYVHAKTLDGYDHRAQAHHFYARNWSFHEPVSRDTTAAPDADVTGMPLIPGLDRHWHGSSVHVLFPNFAISTGGTFWASIEIEPVAPEACRLDLRIRGVAPPAELPRWRALPAEAARRGLAAIREARSQATRGTIDPRALAGAATRAPERPLGVLEEDAYCCEAIQTGLRSPNFEIGPIAPRYEQSVLMFQRNILDLVPLEGRAPAQPA
jgi:Rieske 2Fe-2S family protein